MNAFYLTFVIIDLALGIPLWRDWQRLRKPSATSGAWYAAAVLIALSSLAWLLLLLVTISSWLESLGPGPKPHFLVMWVIMLFVYGGLRSLRALVRLPQAESDDVRGPD